MSTKLNQNIIDLYLLNQEIKKLDNKKERIRKSIVEHLQKERIISATTNITQRTKVKVTLSYFDRTSIDLKSLKEDEPEIYEEYKRETHSKMLKVTKVKNKRKSKVTHG